MPMSVFLSRCLCEFCLVYVCVCVVGGVVSVCVWLVCLASVSGTEDRVSVGSVQYCQWVLLAASCMGLCLSLCECVCV